MSKTILLVDDEPPIAAVLSRALRARNWTVLAASTGEQALATIESDIPHVVLLDINLPDITGWEVLRRIPPDVRGRLPVVVFSASPLAPSRVEEFQPAGVLTKPFPVQALLRLVEQLSAQKEEEEEEVQPDA